MSTEAHRFSWTFNTRTGPVGALDRLLPRPRTDGVAFPTHLPPWPHLRFVFDGPLPYSFADIDGARLTLRRHDGAPVYGLADWYDADMQRLHLMVQRGQRLRERRLGRRLDRTS